MLQLDEAVGIDRRHPIHTTVSQTHTYVHEGDQHGCTPSAAVPCKPLAALLHLTRWAGQGLGQLK